MELKGSTEAAMLSAEGRLAELFAKTDELIKNHDKLFAKTSDGLINLEKADAALKESIEARIIALDHDIKAMAFAGGGKDAPPGLDGKGLMMVQKGLSDVQERIVLIEQKVMQVQSSVDQQASNSSMHHQL